MAGLSRLCRQLVRFPSFRTRPISPQIAANAGTTTPRFETAIGRSDGRFALNLMETVMNTFFGSLGSTPRRAALMNRKSGRNSLKFVFAGAATAAALFFTSGAAEANTYQTLWNFPTGNGDGTAPITGLTQYGTVLYGTTTTGGANGFGAVYTLTPGSNVEHVVASFTAPTGEFPRSNLVVHGTLMYGTTYQGGTYSNGTIYTFDPATNLLHSLVSFPDLGDCAGVTGHMAPFPSAQLAFHGSYLYGTRCQGGSYGYGSLYRFKLTGPPSIQTLWNFTNGGDGSYPVVGLTYAAGLYYGTTYNGGATGVGTIFSLDPSIPTPTITTRYSFVLNNGGAGAPGEQPGSPLFYHQGYLYGTTDFGGVNDLGAVFKIQPGPWQYISLRDFQVPDGEFPRGNLAYVGGWFYGNGIYGGVSNVGTIFKFKASNPLTTWSTVGSFPGANLAYPLGGLLLYGTNLYGTTYGPLPGAGNPSGAIFEETTP
jgi:uncharacterized repeat protein (TIGR03803 family)